jgi:hypothetical protein
VNTCACGEPASANGRECGACYRERLRSVSNGYRPSVHRRWDGRLERYRQTRMEGSQPRGTTTAAIDEARQLSDLTGQAFRADTGGFV